jgi:cobalt-zinc-cadmium efflux system outer membrane protein
MLLRRNAGWLIALLVFLSGCTTVSLNAGFAEIGALVEKRNAIKIFWNGGTELDREAAEKVRSLLKGRLTPDEVVQIALLNNRDLQAIYSDLGVAQADLVQAGLLSNPIFNAGVFFPVSGGKPDLELNVVMNFLDLFYRPLRERVAAAQFEETKLRVTGSVLDFAAQVRAAFYAHQANEQMLEMRQTILQSLMASYEVTRRLHEAGNITDLELNRERALAEAAKLDLRSAEMAERQSREQLNDLMGIWANDTEWQTDRRLPDIPAQPMPVEGLERTALAQSIDLSNARQRIVVAGEQLGLDRATALVSESHFGVLGERDEGAWKVGPVLEFPVPLFDQGQARIGRAVAELRRAQQEYYAMAVRIRSAARALRDQIQGARDRALYYRDIMLPLQERIVNEAQLHYNAMQIGPVQLLRAREQQIETAVAYVEALRDYWLARTDLGQILSGRLPGANGAQVGRGGEQMKGGRTRGRRPEGH